MKSPIIATILLVLAAPALASPRHPTPAQWKNIDALEAAHEACNYRLDHEVRKKACATEARLMPKMAAQGFCLVGHGTVGRAGGRISEYRNHCYTISH